MSDAGRVDTMAASPPSLRYAHIGPIIPAHLGAWRYAAALAVVLVIFAIRAALAPVLGSQAPLLPFLLGVLASAYLGGRGPALLAGVSAPILATLWLTRWPHDAPPSEWVAHVAFFVVLAVLYTQVMHALQVSVRRSAAHAQRAETAAKALRDNDRRKDEFLAMLAHELRNPLTPIRNVAHILSRAPDADTVRRASEMLERQGRHLARLVDDLLDVARITHRRIELRREVVNLSRVIDMAIESVQPLLDARHQEVIAMTDTPACVDGDEVRLVQIITNLLTNASKFSAEGRVIRITLSGNDAEAVVSVRDQGQGIDAQLMPHLFDLFMQGDHSLDRSQGGLGIGLTVVKHLVEMHGGRVEASSEGLNRGSEFRIRLPRAPSGSQARPVPADHAVHRRRVLVVEDNADAAQSLQQLLELDGHEVLAVHDGAAALAALENFDAEVVLLDVGLPRMDGHLVAHAIQARNAESASRPRLIALTGYGRDEDRESTAQSGFDDHLTKPVNPAELLRVVSRRNDQPVEGAGAI